MLTQIHDALTTIQQEFGNTRLQHCAVAVGELAESQCRLTGTVLDQATLTAVTRHLVDHFPTITFDSAGVKVLHQTPRQLMTVGTNVAGLHRRPARASERLTELLNGRVFERFYEEDGWVYGRQMDGYLGWILGRYLTPSPPPEPTHIVIRPASLLRAAPAADAALVSRVMSGTMVKVTAVDGEWAHLVLAGERDGWVLLSDLRALDAMPATEQAKRQQMVQDARQFIGVQYLWGGCTGQGIDCSGLAQLAHRMVGINLLRDADMQFDTGKPVQPPFQPGDLLFFGSNSGHRAITHVAVSLGGWDVIHSSGPWNGVYEDDVQAVSWLREKFVGARTFL